MDNTQIDKIITPSKWVPSYYSIVSGQSDIKQDDLCGYVVVEPFPFNIPVYAR